MTTWDDFLLEHVRFLVYSGCLLKAKVISLMTGNFGQCEKSHLLLTPRYTKIRKH